MKRAIAIQITHCPTCGSKDIRRVVRDVPGNFRGRAYLARNVSFEECPNCGERLFDRDAMKKLEAARTERAKTPAKRRALKQRVPA